MIKATVLLSGGLDSAAALLYTRAYYADDEILAVTGYYGQPPAELAAAYHIARTLGVKHEPFILSGFTGGVADSESLSDTPASSIVPCRNLMLIAIAANMGYGSEEIVIGCNKDDVENFSDCTLDFQEAAQAAIRFSIGDHVRLSFPMLDMEKWEVVKYIEMKRPDILKMAISCYRGRRPGCGECHACVTRREAFLSAGLWTEKHEEALG